MTILEYNDICF